jgi:hypothetical protein
MGERISDFGFMIFDLRFTILDLNFKFEICNPACRRSIGESVNQIIPSFIAFATASDWE